MCMFLCFSLLGKVAFPPWRRGSGLFAAVAPQGPPGGDRFTTVPRFSRCTGEPPGDVCVSLGLRTGPQTSCPVLYSILYSGTPEALLGSPAPPHLSKTDREVDTHLVSTEHSCNAAVSWTGGYKRAFHIPLCASIAKAGASTLPRGGSHISHFCAFWHIF